MGLQELLDAYAGSDGEHTHVVMDARRLGGDEVTERDVGVLGVLRP